MEYTFPAPQLAHFAEFYFFEKIFLPHEVDKILALWQEEEKVDGMMSSGSETPVDESLRKSTVQYIDLTDDNRWIYDKLAMVVTQCNMQYYGFELGGFAEKLQLTHYGVDGHFEWHLDFGPKETSHRKLSITVQLSDESEYEGGELLFFVNGKEVAAPKQKGTVVVFPSFIQHKVAKITSGKRQSIVGWAAGNPYR